MNWLFKLALQFIDTCVLPTLPRNTRLRRRLQGSAAELLETRTLLAATFNLALSSEALASDKNGLLQQNASTDRASVNAQEPGGSVDATASGTLTTTSSSFTFNADARADAQPATATPTEQLSAGASTTLSGTMTLSAASTVTLSFASTAQIQPEAVANFVIQSNNDGTMPLANNSFGPNATEQAQLSAGTYTITGVASASADLFTNDSDGTQPNFILTNGATVTATVTVATLPENLAAFAFDGTPTPNITTPPSVPFGFQVAAEDINGHLDTGFTGTVTIGTSGPTPVGGTNSVQAVNGIATFTDLLITTPGNYALTFSSPSLTQINGAFVHVLGPTVDLSVVPNAVNAAPTSFFWNSLQQGGGFTFTYGIDNPDNASIPDTTIDFYWQNADGSNSILAYQYDLSATAVDAGGHPAKAEGVHTIVITQASLNQEASEPQLKTKPTPPIAAASQLAGQSTPAEYLRAAIDPEGLVSETSTANNQETMRVVPLVVDVVSPGFNPDVPESAFLKPFIDLAEDLERVPASNSILANRVASYVSQWDSTPHFFAGFKSLLMSYVLDATGTPESEADASIARTIARYESLGSDVILLSAARTIANDLEANELLPAGQSNGRQKIEFVGHSRGAELNAAIARDLWNDGYTNFADFVSLDGYSDDWSNQTANSGVLTNYSITGLLAGIPFSNAMFNVQAAEGLAHDPAILDNVGPNGAFSFLGGVSQSVINQVQTSTDLRAPLRVEFDNEVISGTTHTTITHAFDSDVLLWPAQLDNGLISLFSNDYLFQNAGATNGSSGTSRQVTTQPAAAIVGAPGFIDGELESISSLEAQIDAASLSPTEDPGLNAYFDNLTAPANILGLFWQTAGDVTLSQAAGSTALSLTLSPSGDASVSQSVVLPADPTFVNFDLQVQDVAPGDVLNLLENGSLLQSIDLTSLGQNGDPSIALPLTTADSATFTFDLSGASGSVGAITLSNFTITSGNRSPVLVPSNPDLPPITSTTAEGENNGMSVAGLAGEVSDQDTEDQLGIAIVGADSADGQVQYSADGGATWSDVGAVSESNALLLNFGPTTRLRFLPNAGVAGSLADVVTFRGWDGTTGIFGLDGDYFDTTNTGGSTAFSVNADSIGIDIALAPTIGVSDNSGVYNGSSFAATATAIGSDGVSPVSGTFAFNYYLGPSVDTAGSSIPPTQAGTYTVVASFSSGDPTYVDATSAPLTFTISKAVPNIAISDGGGNYDAQPFLGTATVAGLVPGVDDTPADELEGVSPTLTYYVSSNLNGPALAGPPTSAGTYVVTAFFVGSQDYDSASSSTTFAIAQSTQTVGFAGSYIGTFSGGASGTAAFTVDANGNITLTSPGTGSGTVDQSGDVHITGAAPSGTPGDDVTFTDVGMIVVSPSGEASGSGTYTAELDGSTFAGRWNVTGTLTPAITVNDNGGVYSGESFPASASVTGIASVPINGEASFTYYEGGSVSGAGTSEAPSNAGIYTVVASFTSGDPNYGSVQSDPLTFAIALNTATVLVSDPGGTYNAAPYAATALVNGVVPGVDDTPASELEGVSPTFAYYAGSSTNGAPLLGPPTNAGTYTVVASFPGSQDYASATSSPETFAIAPATPTVVVMGTGGTYDGSPFPAVASSSGVNGDPVNNRIVVIYYPGADLSGPGSPIAPTDAGIYTEVANLTSFDPNYTNVATNPLTFAIAPANPVVGVTDPGGSYNGEPFAASATIAGVVTAVDDSPAASLEGAAPTLTYFVGADTSGTALTEAPTNAGTYTVLASFAGSTDYAAAAETSTFTVSPAAPVLSYRGLYTGTFTGFFSGDSAFVVDASGNITVTEPGLGTGTVTQSGAISITGEADGIPFSDTGSIVVSPSGQLTASGTWIATYQNQTVSGTWSVTGPPDSPVYVSSAGGTYDGNPISAIATATGVDGVTPISGSYAFTYYEGSAVSGPASSIAPTEAGTYTVLASFTSDDPNYDYVDVQSPPYSFTIIPATPTVVAADSGGVYNGNALPAAATATGVGGTGVNGSFAFTYYAGSSVNGTGSSFAPTNSGTYTVVAAFTSTDPNYAVGPTQTVPVTFTIAQATPGVVGSDVGGTYNGDPFPATATATGIGGAAVSGSFAFIYYVGDGVSGSSSAAPPTSAGTYTVVAAFSSTDPNYGGTDSSPVTFTISQATPRLSLTDVGGIYDGQSFPATDSVAGVVFGVDNTPGPSLEGISPALTYYSGATSSGTPLSGAPMNTGTYTVVAAFAGSEDYMQASTSAAFTISQATPVVTVSDAGGTYNGSPFTATARATGVDGAAINGTVTLKYYAGSSVSGSGTSKAPANVGTYTVVAAFATTNANYVAGPTVSAPLTFTITPAISVASPSAASLVENSSIVFSTSSGNAITLTDPSASATSDSLKLTVTHGTLALGSTSGLTFSSGVNDSSSMTVTGTLTNLNAALNGLQYVPATNFSGLAALAVTFKDSTGNQIASATVAISVNPHISAPATASVDENGSVTFSTTKQNAISLTDGGATSTSDSLTLSTTNGTLKLGSTSGLTFSAGSNGSASMTVTGTLAQLNAAVSGLTFTSAIGFTGSTSLQIALSNSHDGLGASATVALSVSIPASRPSVTVGTPITTAVPGEPVPLVVQATDTNATAQAGPFAFGVSFGDGRSTTFTSKSPIVLNHIYAGTGAFTVTVIATDEYGRVSASSSVTINIVEAAVETNPFNTKQTALFVGGTSGNDTIQLASAGTGIVAVTVNGMSAGSFSTTGPVIVMGQGGTDTVNKGTAVKNAVDLLESPTSNNLETDLDKEAIQWAGLTAAVEVLNA
jgi:hypothetical protein